MSSDNTAVDKKSDNSISFAPDKNENVFLSLLFNIILPVQLLERLTPEFVERFGEHGPLYALILALAFPIAYGLYDYLKNSKKNPIAILGFFNILFTGGLAVIGVEGIWFAVKEAAFPLLIGLFVYLSIYGKRPFVEMFIYNDKLLNIDLIEKTLEEKGNSEKIHEHLRKSTVFLAGSFVLSAILNFVLAKIIFVEIDKALPNVERAAILNEQIAEMTWLSYVVIVGPSIICLAAILWHLFAGIQKLTHLNLTDLMKQQ